MIDQYYHMICSNVSVKPLLILFVASKLASNTAQSTIPFLVKTYATFHFISVAASSVLSVSFVPILQNSYD